VGLYCRAKEKDVLPSQKKCKHYAEHTLTKKEFTIGILQDALFCALCRYGVVDSLPGGPLHCAIHDKNVRIRDVACTDYSDWRGPIIDE